MAGAGILLLWPLFLVWDPPDDRRASICLLRRTTGLSCPTCGMTRATARLVHGEVRAAAALHPLAAPFWAQVLAGWVWWGWRMGRGHRLELGRGFGLLVAGNAAVFFGLWLYRLLSGTLPP